MNAWASLLLEEAKVDNVVSSSRAMIRSSLRGPDGHPSVEGSFVGSLEPPPHPLPERPDENRQLLMKKPVGPLGLTNEERAEFPNRKVSRTHDRTPDTEPADHSRFVCREK